jgi:hypothetical protein
VKLEVQIREGAEQSGRVRTDGSRMQLPRDRIRIATVRIEAGSNGITII